MRNVVMLAAGAGEEILYCGGALRLHAEAGDVIRTAAFLSDGELQNDAAEEAHEIIGGAEYERSPLPSSPSGLRAALSALFEQHVPNLIYAPDEGLRPGFFAAVRDVAPKSAEILLYGECSRSPGSEACVFADISGGALEAKLEALKALSSTLHGAAGAEALARWSGAEAGTEAAEAFSIGRRVGRIQPETQAPEPQAKPDDAPDVRPLFLVTMSTDAFGLPPLAPGENEAVPYEHTYPMRLRTLLQQRLPHVKVEVQNFTGRGTGAQATWGRMHDLFSALAPGACVLQFGLADCWLRAGKDGKPTQTTPVSQFAQYWDAILKKKRELAPDLPLAVVGIPLTDATTGEKFPRQNAEIRAYNKAIQKLLGEDAAYIDMESFFEQHGDDIYAESGRSLSGLGHALLANALAEAFVSGDEEEENADDQPHRAGDDDDFNAEDFLNDMPPPEVF